MLVEHRANVRIRILHLVDHRDFAEQKNKIFIQHLFFQKHGVNIFLWVFLSFSYFS